MTSIKQRHPLKPVSPGWSVSRIFIRLALSRSHVRSSIHTILSQFQFHIPIFFCFCFSSSAAKRRRAAQDFPGASIIVEQLKNGCSRRRVGIRLEKGPPARHGVPILVNDDVVGEVTSGCPSPSLGGNVAMGYVRDDLKKLNTKVNLKIRDKQFEACIAKMPFTPAHYYNKPKQ